MKKFIQLLIALSVTATLVLGVLLFDSKFQPNVGWNSGPSTAAAESFKLPPGPQPMVGWNS